MSSNKKSSSSLWFLLAILGLIGLSGFLFMKNNNMSKELVMQNKQFTELQTVNTELDAEYQSALESIESYRSDSKELNEMIDGQKAELAAQKKKINGLIWTKKELNKAKEEIASIQGMTAGYLTQITDLNSKIASLEVSNTKLKEEKTVLITNLDEQKIKTAEVEEARTVLVKNVEEKVTEISELNNIVDIGSAVKINWLQVTGHQLKEDGKLKKKKKAKDINVLRICYKTETNVVTQAGEETFHVRYINPAGETIAVEDAGSGMITNKLTDQKVKYTTQGNVDYKNTDTEACMDWHSNYPFTKGAYAVEIYNKGYLTGKGDFKLK